MTDVKPSEETFSKLLQLDVVAIRDGKYVYSSVFESNVEKMKRKGVSRLKQLSMGRKARRMSSTILAYPSFRNKRNIENLVVAYVCLDYHMNIIKKKLPRHHDQLVYAVWYLNDNEPEVEK